MRGLIALCVGALAAIIVISMLVHYGILFRTLLSGYPIAFFLGLAIYPTELRFAGRWNDAENFWLIFQGSGWLIVGAALSSALWPALLPFRLGLLATFLVSEGLPKEPPRCTCGRYVRRCACGNYLRTCPSCPPTFHLVEPETH